MNQSERKCPMANGHGQPNEEQVDEIFEELTRERLKS